MHRIQKYEVGGGINVDWSKMLNLSSTSLSDTIQKSGNFLSNTLANAGSKIVPDISKMRGLLKPGGLKDLGNVIGGGFNNLLGQGASGANVLGGLKNFTGLNPSGITGIAGDLAGMGLDALGVHKADSNNLSTFDKGLGIARQVTRFIPGAGWVASAALEGLDLINKYAGRTSAKQGTADMGNIYGYGMADINQSANTKYTFSDTVKGWFGKSKREKTNEKTKAYNQMNLLKSVPGYDHQINLLASSNVAPLIQQKNQQQLLGGVNTRMLAAKKGTKIPPAKLRSIIEKAQKGMKIKEPNTFDSWYKTIPKDRNDTTNYNLKRAYELADKEELEKWRTATPEQLKDSTYHLKTFYWNDAGIGEFVKSKKHPTIKHEIDWYYSDKAKDFRVKYDLVDDGTDYYKYKPIKEFKDGGKVNVIPEGAFHSRKNNLPTEISEQVTPKGIPVVSEEGGGILKQHAEIERNEIIFHKEATETMEELLEKYDNAKDQKEKDAIAIKCGKYITKEILVNTDDRTGLIDSIK